MIKVFALFSMQNVVSCGTFNVLLWKRNKKPQRNLCLELSSKLSVQCGKGRPFTSKNRPQYQTYYYKVILMIHFILSPAFETVMYLHPIIYSHLKYVSIPTISKKKSCFENINVYIVIWFKHRAMAVSFHLQNPVLKG